MYFEHEDINHPFGPFSIRSILRHSRIMIYSNLAPFSIIHLFCVSIQRTNSIWLLVCIKVIVSITVLLMFNQTCSGVHKYIETYVAFFVKTCSKKYHPSSCCEQYIPIKTNWHKTNETIYLNKMNTEDQLKTCLVWINEKEKSCRHFMTLSSPYIRSTHGKIYINNRAQIISINFLSFYNKKKCFEEKKNMSQTKFPRSD